MILDMIWWCHISGSDIGLWPDDTTQAITWFFKKKKKKILDHADSMLTILRESSWCIFTKLMAFSKFKKSKSQKCFIAVQEKVYIDQNNKTEAHSGLFVPLIWEYHCIILTSFWFNRLVGCKGPADTWHDEVITTFKLHDIFLTQ